MYNQKKQRFLFSLTFIIPVITAVLWLIVALMPEQNRIISDTVATVIEFSITIITVIAEYYFISKHKEYKINKEIDNLKSQVLMVEDYYNELEIKMESVSKIRHELRHYMEIIDPESETGQELLFISNSIDSNNSDISTVRYCDNRIINIIIDRKAVQAKCNNIEFDCSLSIPDNLPVNSFDLCSCFINLLDNAIRANENQAGDLPRWIKIKSSVKGSYLIIKQSNSAYDKVYVDNKGKFLTSRIEKDGHGYGISILNDICKKYDGYCDFQYKDNVFESLVVISLNPSK